MINAITEMFSLSFMLYAIIAGIFISVCSSLLGVSLVLKRYSMIGDGLSHVAFGSLAIATALNIAPLKLAIPVVVASAFLLLRLNEKGKLKGDAIIAIISTGALAVGVMAISCSTGMNIDIYNYMFGSILALTKSDVLMSAGLAAFVIPMFILQYNKIFAVTFDSGFARATGVKTGVYDTVFSVLTAITVVLGMRLMGTLLISSLIVFPPLTSMRVFKTFKSVVICSAVIPVISFLTGISISYFLSTPPGASVVIVNIILLLIFSLFELIKSKVKVKG